MPINRILTSQEDFYIAIRQLDDEINNLRTQLATIQAQVKNGVKNGSGSTTPTPPAQKVTFAGDLTGDINSQTVVGIQGNPVNSTTPSTNQVLEWNGSTWIPTNLPTIPAAQVNSDWNASSGVAMILNKPIIPAAQVNSDWNASSGVAQILNKPTIPSSITFAGDLSGTSTSQTVIGLQGKSVSTQAPTTNQILTWTAANKWEGASGFTMSAGCTFNGGVTFNGGTTFNGGQTVIGAMCFQDANNKKGCFSVDGTGQPVLNFSGGANTSLKINGGLLIPNSTTIGFYDAGNTYIAHQISVGSGNAWNLSSSTTGNAGSYVATIQATNTGAITLVGPLTCNSSATIKGTGYFQPTSGDAINITGTDGKNVTMGSSTSNSGAYWWTNAAQTTIYGPLNLTGTITYAGAITGPNYINIQSAYALRVWDSTNTKYGQLYSDANGNLNITSTGGATICQALTASNTIQGNNGITVAGGTLIVQGPSSKYFQILPNDGTYSDPRIYSSTGNIRTFCSMSFDSNISVGGTSIVGGVATFNSGATFNAPANITFGSNWQTWTPTLTANAGTLTPTAWYYNYYIRIGPLVFFSIRFAFNASAAFGYFYVTMPVTGFTPSNNYMAVGNCMCESGPLTLENLLMRWELSDHVVIQRAGGTGFAIGNSYLICMSGFYRCA